MPSSPTSVSSPSGSVATQSSRRARRSARASSSSVAPGRARRRFSRIVESNTCASWPARANVRRTSSCRRSRTSRPPIVTRPCSGSRKRSRRFVTVVFPAPLGPTSATRPPGSSRRSKRSSAGARVSRVPGGHAFERDHGIGARAPAPGAGGSAIADSRSVSSRTRRPARERRRQLARGRREAARRPRTTRARAAPASRRGRGRATRRRAPRRRPRARRRPSGLRRGSRRVREPRDEGVAASEPDELAVGVPHAREGVLLPTVGDELGRTAQELDELGGELAPRGCLSPADPSPEQAGEERTPIPPRARPTARTSAAAGRTNAIATHARDRHDQADERRPEAAQVQPLERVDVARPSGSGGRRGGRPRARPARAARSARRRSRGSVPEPAARGRGRRAARGSARAGGRARGSGRRRRSWSARGSAVARRRARSGSRPSSSAPTPKPDREHAEGDRRGRRGPRGSSASARSRRTVGVTPPPPRARGSDRPRGGRPGRRARRARAGATTSRTVRPSRSRSIASATSAALAGSRSAVGSSRITSGAVAEERTRERDPPPLARRELAPAVADDRLVPVRELATRSRPRRRARAAWRTRSSPAAASPSRMLSATVPRKSVGRCGTSAIVPPPRVPVEASRARARRRGSARRTAPAKRSSSETSVLLPPPLGPTTATVSPGRSSRLDVAEDVVRLASGSRTRRARTRSATSAGSGGRARAAGDAGTPRRGRASARRPQPRRRSRGTAPRGCAAAGTARARGRARSAPARSRSRPPRAARRRRPRRARSRASRRARARRRTGTRRGASPSSRVGTRRSPRRCRSFCACPRLNARSVGSPRTTSRKWFERSASACQRSRARRSV